MDHRTESLDGKGVPLAPTRILFWVLFFRKRLTRPQGNYCTASQRSVPVETCEILDLGVGVNV